MQENGILVSKRKVASRLFFLMHIIEVFTRRFPGVLLEAAAEITRVVESRAISDFGDAHLLVFLHVLKGSRDACGNDEVYRRAVEKLFHLFYEEFPIHAQMQSQVIDFEFAVVDVCV